MRVSILLVLGLGIILAACALPLVCLAEGDTKELKEEVCPQCQGEGGRKVKCQSCPDKSKDPLALCEVCEEEGFISIKCSSCQGTGKLKFKSDVVPTTESGEKVECPLCYGTGRAVCDKCAGTGQKHIKCQSCQSLGKCHVCKGEKVKTCHQCKGKGTITKTVVYGGAGGTKQKRRTVVCPTCAGETKVSCKTCKTTGTCQKCKGKGSISMKQGCPVCKGAGKAKCSLCRGQGQLDEAELKKAQVITYRDVINEIVEMSKKVEEATDLRREYLKKEFLVKWNEGFVDKAVRWEGSVREVSKKQIGGKAKEAIELELQCGRLLLAMWISTEWEKHLLVVSPRDTLVFLMTLPQSHQVFHSPEAPSLDLRQKSQLIQITLLGYRKYGEKELTEFTLVPE